MSARSYSHANKIGFGSFKKKQKQFITIKSTLQSKKGTLIYQLKLSDKLIYGTIYSVKYTLFNVFYL